MSSTAADPVLPPPVLTEVADGVFAYVQPDGTWWVNNTGLLVGARGAAVVDTCSTEKRTRAFRDAVAAVTDQPVRTLVNTHHHGDHTHGNWLFGGRHRGRARGHPRRRARRRGAGDQPFWTPFDVGEVVLEPPFLTYTEGVTLWVDDRRCEVTHVGTPAHTTNDSVVWLPEQRTLFAGDLLFAGGTPFLVMGSLAGAIEVLEQVVAPLGAQTIVPGHGRLSGPELVDDVLGYLRWLDGVARDSHAAGGGTPGGRPQHRPGPVRRVVRRRAHRGQPAPRARRAVRWRARLRDRRPGRPGRHGHLQRRPAPHLHRLTRATVPGPPGPGPSPAGTGAGPSERSRPMRDAVIVEAVRTPVGKRNGGLSGVHPVSLSAHVLRELVSRTGVDPALVDDVVWGCVSQIGEQTYDVARNAVLSAGWPESVPGTTVDRQCGSSQQAVHFAAAGLVAGHYDVVVAGEWSR